MRKRRRITNSANRSKPFRAKHSFHTLECSKSGCSREVRADKDVISVICWECCQKMVGIDPKYLHPVKKTDKKESGFPRGWHLYKIFVHADGRVFDFGKENKKLKGTKPPTKIKVDTLTKSQRRRLRDEKKAKREARIVKQYKKKIKMKGQLNA